MPNFKLEGEAPIEIKVNEKGQPVFMDGRVLIRLTDGRVMLAVNEENWHPLEQSSRAKVVPVKLGSQDATGVCDIDIPINIKGDQILVNLMTSVWRILLPDGTYFVLPVSGITRLPSPAGGIIFVTTKAVVERARRIGRSDVVSPVIASNTASSPICNKDGEPVLIQALA